MARGTQFLDLVERVRNETGRAPDVNVGKSDLPGIKETINRVYQTLYDEHDWPHLRRVFPRIPLSAGQRYYDPPADLNFDRIEKVATWYNAIPHELPRGIGFEEYATYDSEADERTDPALRWDVRWTGEKEQIEIWPLPAGNDSTLQFIGIQAAPRLVNDIDVCLLDDHLVVLYAAAELLLRQESGDAEAKLRQAQERLRRVKQRSQSASAPIRMGLGHTRLPTASRVVVRVR